MQESYSYCRISLNVEFRYCCTEIKVYYSRYLITGICPAEFGVPPIGQRVGFRPLAAFPQHIKTALPSLLVLRPFPSLSSRSHRSFSSSPWLPTQATAYAPCQPGWPRCDHRYQLRRRRPLIDRSLWSWSFVLLVFMLLYLRLYTTLWTSPSWRLFPRSLDHAVSPRPSLLQRPNVSSLRSAAITWLPGRPYHRRLLATSCGRSARRWRGPQRSGSLVGAALFAKANWKNASRSEAGFPFAAPPMYGRLLSCWVVRWPLLHWFRLDWFGYTDQARFAQVLEAGWSDMAATAAFSTF